MSPTHTAHSRPRAPKSSFEQTLQNVGHLIRRAGFGDTSINIMAAAQQGLQATIDRLVGYTMVEDPFTPPDLSQFQVRTAQVAPLTQWWVNRMITTNRPFQEKMV